MFWSIYLSESCRKSGFISLLHICISNSHKKKCFNFIRNINVCKYIYISKYFRIIFISIILNVNNDPCFEDKSSSLTLRYRPVHFFKNSCINIYKWEDFHLITLIYLVHICWQPQSMRRGCSKTWSAKLIMRPRLMPLVSSTLSCQPSLL